MSPDLDLDNLIKNKIKSSATSLSDSPVWLQSTGPPSTLTTTDLAVTVT